MSKLVINTINIHTAELFGYLHSTLKMSTVKCKHKQGPEKPSALYIIKLLFSHNSSRVKNLNLASG